MFNCDVFIHSTVLNLVAAPPYTSASTPAFVLAFFVLFSCMFYSLAIPHATRLGGFGGLVSCATLYIFDIRVHTRTTVLVTLISSSFLNPCFSEHRCSNYQYSCLHCNCRSRFHIILN
ncbi:hypothetical protein DEU56DRAFT_244479 [Suillus clintonianus]|uniref:uncharacterized protein n=1 Tax=Suillus clintonianus TaxID=1904413 RepID=UPI001B85E13F|nr:uncharacterized protein DEU56DRAFT_244479 [Suillus clintonianus]KAG2143643.1 hypothetical protein DEU56DRAFT_244479 [Suillus clintonianus]